MEPTPSGKVTVERFPARSGDSPRSVPLTDGMTLGQLMDLLHLPADTEAVLVNGVHARPDYRLKDGDHVRIIPFMSGG